MKAKLKVRNFRYSTVKLIFALLICSICTGFQFKKTNPKKDGFVPNKETAIKIAEAVWLPIYGNMIYNSKPFKAELLKDSVWKVYGTLPKGWEGGIPYAEIRKMDGKIITAFHSK